MFVTVMIGAIVGLAAALIGSMIALGIQRRAFAKTLLEHEAWERAQESQQHSWEAQQEKRSLAQEHRLASQIEQVESEWQAWKTADAARVQEVSAQYAQSTAQLNLERDVSRLPYIEEVPLHPMSGAMPGTQARYGIANWQPPSFYRADLSGRDLSRRYLGHVDLREAQLVGTSFYMADLSDACLAGADLSQADLSAANLSGADLRYATLVDANLLVTDLHKAVLLGANLLGTRHLTARQLSSAIYDSSTRFEAEADVTLARLPAISATQASSEPAPATLPPPAEEMTAVVPDPLPVVDTLPETPQPVSPSEISPVLDEEPFELLPLLSFPVDDRSPELVEAPEADLPEKASGEPQSTKTASAPSRLHYSGKRRAKGNNR